MKHTLAHLGGLLHDAGEDCVTLAAADLTLLITRRGGRVLGLFPAGDGPNLLWTNSAAFASPAAFRAFTAAGHWNLGGERIWIAPEIQYNVRDRADFWGTLAVPPAMDPGEYVLASVPGAVHLSLKLALPAFNMGHGTHVLELERRLRPSPAPLPAAELPAGVIYGGWQHQVRLAGTTPGAVSAAWNLVQVNAGGQLVLPCLPPVVAADYFGSVPAEARQVQPGPVPHLRLHLTGRQQYKIGYGAAGMTGRMAYHHTLDDGRDYLLIRSFFNNPSDIYPEEPPARPGVRGHSVHVYNDGGEFGGANAFGEMECTGATVVGGSPVLDAVDTFVLWAYVGPPGSLHGIAQRLMGVS